MRYTYELTKQLIQNGGDKEDIRNKLSVFLLFNEITEEEYQELYVLNSAEPESEQDEEM